MTLALTMRRATVEDIAAIVALLADDHIGHGREDPQEPLNRCYGEAFEAIDSDPNQLLAVAEIDGAVIGCLQISFIAGLSRLGMLRGQIEGVRAARGHRGAGVGKRMVEWAIEQCRAKGCGLVQITTDKRRPDALRFYESLGFRASHEGMKLSLE